MQPNSEPTPADIAAVSAHLGGQPAPAPEPTPAPAPQMQPADPTPQPAPTQQPTDPFASLFASEPAATPTEPVAPAAPTEPTQPTEPTPQPQQPVEPQPAPQEPAAPQPAPQQPAAQEYETFDEYMARVTANVPQAPAQPDPEQIDPNDPAAIKGFFDDLVNTAVQRSNHEIARRTAMQTAEKAAWDSAFDKYGSLRTNKALRDTVHTIRMGYFQRGVALTPTQAADKLLESMGQERRAGAAGAQVVTTYENVQPNGGGSGAPVPTNLDNKTALERVQTGGETALADILDAEIKAGRL